MDLLFAGYAFALGAIIGSFLNVVIYRYPIEKSIVSPPSSCTSCGERIRWFDNIPIVSWLVLLGRCRFCRTPIAPTYPLIELANGLFYLAIYLHLGPNWTFIPVAAIVSMTLVLIFIDLDIQILPDVVDVPGIAVGLLIGWAAIGAHEHSLMLSSSLKDSLIGAAAGAALLWLVSAAYQLVRGIEGMGMGDVKMLAMIGAVFGWQGVLPVLFLASLTGAILGLGIAARSKEGLMFALPFGVFLGIATLVMIFFGHTLFAWYASLLMG